MWTSEGALGEGLRRDYTLGDRVIVHFRNELRQPTTVHWHGLRISDAMDGSPRIQAPVPEGGTFTYDFVVPGAGTFWYHPHVQSKRRRHPGAGGALAAGERGERAHAAALPDGASFRVIGVDGGKLAP